MILLLACADPAPDPTAYVDAVRATRDDPKQAAALCAHVGGDAGDECASWAAAALTREGDPVAAAAICDGLANPVWQDECRFLVAEETERTDGPEAAARRCRSAGRFLDKCLFHVWKGVAAALADRPPLDAVEAYAPALAWADGALAVDHRFELRFWETFFDARFATAVVDPAACDGFGAQADTCRTVLPAVLVRRLQRPEARKGRPTCPPPATPATRADDVRHATGTEYVPAADLDEVAMGYYGRTCPSPAPPDPR